MITNATYDRIDDEGLHYQIKGEDSVLKADTYVLCTGQLSANQLLEPLKQAGVNVSIIGGAHESAELDAKAAINEATRLAYSI